MAEIPYDPKVLLDTIVQLHRESKDTSGFNIYKVATHVIKRDEKIVVNQRSVDNRNKVRNRV